jgi:hypothetical protein
MWTYRSIFLSNPIHRRFRNNSLNTCGRLWPSFSVNVHKHAHLQEVYVQKASKHLIAIALEWPMAYTLLTRVSTSGWWGHSRGYIYPEIPVFLKPVFKPGIKKLGFELTHGERLHYKQASFEHILRPYYNFSLQLEFSTTNFEAGAVCWQSQKANLKAIQAYFMNTSTQNCTKKLQRANGSYSGHK